MSTPITPNYKIGFTHLACELTQVSLPVSGKIPSWLEGILIRNGPAKFSTAQQTLNHWFDGFAMLHKFDFSNGNVFYTNKFISSNAFQMAQKTGKLHYMEFATNPQLSFLQRIQHLLSPPLTDNTNVNILPWQQQLLALTETTHLLKINPDDLSTQGKSNILNKIPGQLTTAHPHYHYLRNELINFTVSLGIQNYYNIFRLSNTNHQAELICKIRVKNPGYMHSFAMTENFIILVEFPFLLHLSKLLSTYKTYLESYQWQPEQGMRFYVIDLNKNKLIATLTGDPCFAFHHINAFENNNEIIIDLAGYTDTTITQSFYLNNLTNIPTTKFLRYRLNLLNKHVTREPFIDINLEFPRLNYNLVNAQKYRYCYAASERITNNFLDQLIKIDLESNQIKQWYENNCYPGEPVFVASPSTNKEDDGVILSMVLNAKSHYTFLIILDAQSFSEIARINLPHIIPFGFHGTFIKK